MIEERIMGFVCLLLTIVAVGIVVYCIVMAAEAS